MIRGICIQNFKGIGEPASHQNPVELELAPVTLLFGSNSAGKSTIFHAFLYAYEVLVKGNRNPDATELGGKSVDLGGFATFVHRHELARPIGIELEIDLKSEKLDQEHPMAEYLVGAQEIDLSTIGEDVWDARIGFRVSWDFDKAEPYVSEYSVILNHDHVATVTCARSRGGNCQMEINFDHELFAWPLGEDVDSVGVLDLLYPRLRSQLEQAYVEAEIVGEEALEGPDGTIVVEMSNDEFDRPDELRMAYCTADDGREFAALLQRRHLSKNLVRHLRTGEPMKRHKDSVEIREFRFARANRWSSQREAQAVAAEQARIWSTVRPKVQMKTDRDALPDWTLPLELNLLPDNPAEAVERYDEDVVGEYHRVFTDLVSRLVVVPGRILARALAGARYIGPLREIPARSHQAPLTPDPSRWSAGLAAWDVLCRADDGFLELVSHWLASSDRLGTAYSVIRKRFKELESDSYIMRILEQDNPLDDLPIALDAIRNLPDHARLMLREEDSLVEVEPQDIAVGITQLVPVVVAALDQHDGISLIEQPELHNHPAVEVGLGDLFIQTIQQEHCRFLLETHGEHLILRMLRRIRQTTDGELPEGIPGLLPDQVAVYYVERTADGVTVKRLRIDETGEFIDKWPRGFFRERAEELF